jgi:hypothetical protein
MANQFFQRRWLDFRNGHTIYLAFILTFVNFILITYNFAIGKVPFLQGFVGNIGAFAAVFILLYIPAAIGAGYWHRKRQYSVENEALLRENWIWAWIMLYEIRLLEGKATPEESKKVKDYLKAILMAQKKDALVGPEPDALKSGL